MSFAGVPPDLGAYVAAGVVSESDLEGARVLVSLSDMTLDERDGTAGAHPLVWLMVGLVMRTVRDGHSCVDLDDIGRWGPETAALEWPLDPGRWLELLGAHPHLIGEPSGLDTRPRPPLVRDGHRVYMARVFHEETLVAQRLTSGGGQGVRIVLGGPGTGKTTWVARTLAQWKDGSVPPLALCAPTGKASRRMKDVLEAVLRTQGAPDAVLAALTDAPSVTVHRLLGTAPARTPRYTHHAGNPLPYKLVIVDEASMMSLDIMARLLDALEPDAQIWLVGDPDQLASVGAGTVLADIARGSENDGAVLSSRVTRLREQHRFPEDSPIARLADAVRAGSVDAVGAVLAQRSADLEWIDPQADPGAVTKVVAEVVAHARSMVEAARSGDAAGVLALKSALQVLSATHAGALGVNDWNRLVEEQLGAAASRAMYPGKPLLVTRNDSSTGLANGDVGVVCAAEANSTELVVAFGDVDAPVEVPLVRLPQVTTVHALTIHKSQGSEYDHVVVVLPQTLSRIVSRELLYTGVSRPRKRLTLIATVESLERAVTTRVQRATGLADRL